MGFARVPIDERWWRELARDDAQPHAQAAVRLAGKLAREGHAAVAEELLRMAIDARDPRISPRAALRLAALLQRLGRTEDAAAAFGEAARLSEPASSPDVVLDLAARWAALGRTRQAADAYLGVMREAHAVAPSVAALASYRLAHLQLEAGRRDEAVGLLRHAQKTADGDLLPHVLSDLIGLIEAVAPKRAELTKLLERLVATNHRDKAPEAALKLARRLGADGQLERAMELFERVIESAHPEYADEARRARSAMLVRRVYETVRTRLSEGEAVALARPTDVKGRRTGSWARSARARAIRDVDLLCALKEHHEAQMQFVRTLKLAACHLSTVPEARPVTSWLVERGRLADLLGVQYTPAPWLVRLERSNWARRGIALLRPLLPPRLGLLFRPDAGAHRLRHSTLCVQVAMGTPGNGEGLLAVHIGHVLASLWVREPEIDGFWESRWGDVELDERDPGVARWLQYQWALRDVVEPCRDIAPLNRDTETTCGLHRGFH